MTQAVWKFTLHLPSCPPVVMPLGAQVLSAGEQNGDLQLWALVDPNEQRLAERAFNVYGTGHTISGNAGRFIGTVAFYGGALILHVFEAVR